MGYDFDEVINRKGTYCMKYDGFSLFDSNVNDKTIPLMIADMDFKTAPPVIEAMHRVADFGIYGYTVYFAEPKYRNSVVRWFKDRYKWEIDPEDVFFSNGTIEALKNAIVTFSKVGDGVILCRPVYGHFTDVINECYRKVVDSHLIKDKTGYWSMDFEDIEKKCADPQNRILVLCNPHNPIGRVWTSEELKTLAAICIKYHVLIVSDEVHCDITRKGVQHYPLAVAAEDQSNIIMLTALNKTFNLAGMQCSNVIISDKFLKERFMKTFGHRSPTPFAIAATVAAYTDCDEWVRQLNDYIDENINWVMNFLSKEIPLVKVTKPEGTYCMWLDFSAYGLTDKEIHKRIYSDANVYMQDGTVHDPKFGQCCQRICVPAPKSIIMEAMQRVAAQF